MSSRRSIGWATETLDGALWRSAALGVALWQLLVGLLVVARTPEHRTHVLLLHVVVFVVALAAVTASRHPAPRVAFFGALALVLSADLLVTTDTLSVTVLCLTQLLVATPFLVMRVALAVPVVAASIGCAAIAATAADLGTRIVLAVVVPALFFGIAAWILMNILRRFAATVDAADLAAQAERDRLIAAQASSRTAAEYARTLHDTVINTLAAVAAGGPGLADTAQVRTRCAADVATIRGLGAGKGAVDDELERLGAGLALDVAWTGLSGPARQDLLQALPPARRTALRGIVKELLLNVEKHAGTRAAAVHVAAEDTALVVVVTDEGVGFDVRGTDHGSRVQSVARRAADSDIRVTVASAPGEGTEARVECPLRSNAADPTDPTDLGGRAGQIRRTAAWAWAALVGIASLVIPAVGSATLGSLGAAVLVLLVALVAWWSCRDGSELSRPGEGLVVTAVPVAFVLGFAGANLQNGDPAFWPAVGLTPLLVILLNVTRTPRPLLAAVGALVVAAATTAWAFAHTRPEAAGTAVANACLQLAQLSTWLIFVAVLDRITDRSARARREALRAREDRVALDVARRTREHWRDAQLQVALDLLGDIADARRFPDDPVTQRFAAREEHALRQLLLLDPELVHLSPWLARIVARSRERGVRVTVHAGSVDLPDPATADRIGSALVDLLGAVAEETRITVAYFGDHPGARVTIVGPPGFVDHAPSVGTERGPRVLRLSTQDLVQLDPGAS